MCCCCVLRDMWRGFKARHPFHFIRTTINLRHMHVFSEEDTSKFSLSLIKMVKETVEVNSGPERSHKCGLSCLGPLTFHGQATGDQVSLSRGGQLAERTRNKFNHGLVFSSRPVNTEERLRLKVERNIQGWHGAMRVGFTTVPPGHRSLPLPSMAIPNLTDTPGHWAAPIPEAYCSVGSELEFWVSDAGKIYFTRNQGEQRKLLSGVDVSKPVWAMIDIYGQTCCVLLLGSEKKTRLLTKKSCPVHIPSRNVGTCYSLNHVPSSHPCSGSLHQNKDNCISHPAPDLPPDSEAVNDCVVCMGEEGANVTLRCGHKCLCLQCADKVFEQFGTCPLCRQEI